MFALNKKLRKKSFLLVINMSFADLMLGALAHGQKFETRVRTDGFRLRKYCRKAFSVICMGKNYCALV